MAATLASSSAIIGLGCSSLSSSSRIASPKISSLNSDFLKSSVFSKSPLNQTSSSRRDFTCNFERNWLRTDYNVIGFGLIGWLAPSSIPAIDGKSLTGLFFESIGQELAHFPTPPVSVPSSGCGWSHGILACSFASLLAKLGSREGLRSISRLLKWGISPL